MSTRCLITFIPSKDSVVTFNPNHLPKKNPFEAFDGSKKEGLQNVLKNRRLVNFKAGVPHTTYCHWDGYVEGVGMTLLEHFSEEEKIANLVSVGECSSIYGSVTPYISRGEAFTAPRTDDPSKFAPFSDCDYIYRWSSDCGWEVAKIPWFDEPEKATLDFEPLSDAANRVLTEDEENN